MHVNLAELKVKPVNLLSLVINYKYIFFNYKCSEWNHNLIRYSYILYRHHRRRNLEGYIRPGTAVRISMRIFSS